MPPFHEQLAALLPRLAADTYRETNPATWTYNCIAWAAGRTDAWWWPEAGRFWPTGAPREETLGSFLAAFAVIGYSPCDSAELEAGFEKVALYALGTRPTHAA